MFTDVTTDDLLERLLLQHAPLRPVPLVPAIRAFHAVDELPLWQALEDAAGARVLAPFFAVAWPGAQALARVVGGIDVKGMVVVDVGCGSGVAAIAAAMAGAARVVAVDVDPIALACARLCAKANGVVIETEKGDATDEAVVDGADVVLAGDVVYNADTGKAFASCLRSWTRNRRVIVADSGRPFFDAAGLAQTDEFVVDVPRGVEGVDVRVVKVFRGGPR